MVSDQLSILNAKNRWRKTISLTFARRLFVVQACVALLVACSGSKTTNTTEADMGWVGTWNTAPQLVEPRNVPPEPGLSNNTLRQVVHVSLGGTQIRVRFTNEFSTEPVTLNEAHIAPSIEAGIVDLDHNRLITFGGKPDVIIAPGAVVISDPLAFDLKPLSNVAITLHFGKTSPDITGHPGSRTTSYLQAGNAMSTYDMSGAIHTNHWYVINGIDVMATNANAIAIMGDSITGGRGSGTNKQNRWPDELARRLQANAGTEHVGVLNQGIGGNCVLRSCLGTAALERFERDVLKQLGVRWLVILEGVNDIGGSKNEEGAMEVARNLMAAYETMIDRAHAAGIKVYGATILPFGESFYDSPEHEMARSAVNEWIRTSGRFDAVIDLDASLRQPNHPTRLLTEGDTGDHLHPNERGHRMMAEAIDLTLFEE